jgi:hypothetical protein
MLIFVVRQSNTYLYIEFILLRKVLVADLVGQAHIHPAMVLLKLIVS